MRRRDHEVVASPDAEGLREGWVVSAPPLLEANARSVGTILVPVDFSETSKSAASWACEFARVSSAGVRLIHALEPGREENRLDVGAPPSTEATRANFHAFDALGRELARHVAPVSMCFEEREPFGMIEEYASADDVGMIVLGGHRAGTDRRMFLGSVAERTIRAMWVPVMTVKEHGPAAASRIRRIVLATDFSKDSERALHSAIEWSRRLEADLHVFHALAGDAEDTGPGRGGAESSAADRRSAALDSLRSILDRLSAEGVAANAELSHGPASVEIERYALRSGAGMLILGHRGRRASGLGICGQVAERVLRHVKCSVLMVPSHKPEMPRSD